MLQGGLVVVVARVGYIAVGTRAAKKFCFTSGAFPRGKARVTLGNIQHSLKTSIATAYTCTRSIVGSKRLTGRANPRGTAYRCSRYPIFPGCPPRSQGFAPLPAACAIRPCAATCSEDGDPPPFAREWLTKEKEKSRVVVELLWYCGSLRGEEETGDKIRLGRLVLNWF